MPAKLVLRPGPESGLLTQIVLVGAAASPWGPLVLPENVDNNEMWEGEIILIPRRKYSAGSTKRREGEVNFGELRADQVLLWGYDDPENWGRCYFNAKATEEQTNAE